MLFRSAGSLMGEIQHGHMEQIGYDMYCELLNQVVKELKGEEIVEEIDVQIDLDVTSYIPDEFIENSSQKIEIYQNIALCKNEEDIQNVTDEIIDRYGQMPYEIENLLDIARIKILAREKYILKISQKRENIIFYFDNEKFNFDIVDKLMKTFRNRIKFSPSKEPYITFKLSNLKNVYRLKYNGHPCCVPSGNSCPMAGQSGQCLCRLHPSLRSPAIHLSE